MKAVMDTGAAFQTGQELRHLIRKPSQPGLRARLASHLRQEKFSQSSCRVLCRAKSESWPIIGIG